MSRIVLEQLLGVGGRARKSGAIQISERVAVRIWVESR